MAEDDPAVRESTVDMLSELGYRVLKAVDGQSALNVLESGVPVDLLFSDVVMPGPVTAPELAREARRAQPDIAVLFTSGYTQNAIIHHGRVDPGVELLSKPYRREQLAIKIRHVLRNREQRIAARTAKAVIKPNKSTPAEAARLSILLVEDDKEILGLLSMIMEDLGHEILPCTSAEEAVEAFENGAFNVLFTDVGLPGMSGIDLARYVVGRHPTMRVVLASGYGKHHGADDLKDANMLVLTKPFDVEQVERAIQDLATADVWTGIDETQ